MAGRKRACVDDSNSTSSSSSSSSSGSSSGCKRQAGHREGYYPALVETYPFLVPIEDRGHEGKVVGVVSIRRINEITQVSPVCASVKT